jgi:hypothetical protein
MTARDPSNPGDIFSGVSDARSMLHDVMQQTVLGPRGVDARPTRREPRGMVAGAAGCALLAGLVLVGCQDNVSTPFPPGLEPFEDGDVPGGLPAPAGEQLQTSTSSDGMIRAYGRGLVLAPPSVLWAASKVPEAMVARCNTTRRSFMLANEPQYELSFLVHYVVEDILTIEWDDQWRGEVVDGTSDAPGLAMIAHQKVQGSDFIRLTEGSIQLRATDDPATTELWFVEHLDAISGSADDVLGGMRDNYDALVALAHDQAIPPCRA